MHIERGGVYWVNFDPAMGRDMGRAEAAIAVQLGLQLKQIP